MRERERVQILAQNPWKCGVNTKESNHFWKSDCLTVWSFLHPRIALRFSADKYRDHANTSTSTAVAGLIGAVAFFFDLYTNEILAIPILMEFFGNREDYSPRIMKLWRVTFSVQSLHYCSPPSLSLPWTHQRTLTLSSPPSRVVLILTPSSPSSRCFSCFKGARGFVSPYKCYKYICTRAALHQVEDYAGTKKYYFVIVTFSLIFPPLPPL